MSSPSPPSRRSLPVPPSILSLPASPRRTSLPTPPLNVSLIAASEKEIGETIAKERVLERRPDQLLDIGQGVAAASPSAPPDAMTTMTCPADWDIVGRVEAGAAVKHVGASAARQHVVARATTEFVCQRIAYQIIRQGGPRRLSIPKSWSPDASPVLTCAALPSKRLTVTPAADVAYDAVSMSASPNSRRPQRRR